MAASARDAAARQRNGKHGGAGRAGRPAEGSPLSTVPGTLHIYLGAAPGVGTTSAMLGGAHRRQERGDQVVAAAVVTHGRAHTTAQLTGIDVVPPLSSAPDAAAIDIDAVLARGPDVALVDELGHANAPGSRHEHRWQDAEALLAAGVDVIATVDVRQLASLRDAVARIAGPARGAAVPDAVVRAAARVELVDVAPDTLRQRISDGCVFAPELIDAALDGDFRRGTLIALREVALLWLADEVDAALAHYRAEKKITALWEARERVVVAVSGGPESETLIRRARRVASRSGAELLVVHVLSADGLSGTPPQQMSAVRDLAAELGARVHTVVGDDVSATLLEFAREVNATQLVLGASRRSRWARIAAEGIGAATVQRSGPIDVHMVTHEQSAAPAARSRAPGRRRGWAWCAALAVPSAACLTTATALRDHLGLSGESSVFFLAVLFVALLGGIGPALLSALVSGFLLNYYFVAPLHSFRVSRPGDLLTVALLMVIAAAVAVLVDNAARLAAQARHASRDAELLTLFAGSVLRGADLPGLLERAREAYAQRGVSLYSRTAGVLARAGDDPPVRPQDADCAVDVGDGEHVLMLAGHSMPARDLRVLNALASQAVNLVRQRELTEAASRVSALAEADRLRRGLLSAVSHDLRTPLAAVKAAVSSLRSEDIDFSPEDTAELLATVEESTDQLTALVGNLLDSSRLAAGVVRPELETVYMDEVVHEALVSIGLSPNGFRRHAVERVAVDVGTATVLADCGLLGRVVANVVDNAVRYSRGSAIRVDAMTVGDRVLLRVVDHGPGLPDATDPRLFEPIQRLGDRDNATGTGLGLSVARGFVAAMGGTVEARTTPGGGLTMVVELAAAGGPRW